ncbi:MAG: hypothetical protein ACKOE2_08295, partial [Actinomycetales bacterium]
MAPCSAVGTPSSRRQRIRPLPPRAYPQPIPEQTACTCSAGGCSDRAERETSGVASSDDIRHWASFEMLQLPQEHWEVLQLGNCGSPIETSQGWLVLTHGVGPMRTYALGALLLDLEQPHRVLARTI